MPYKYYIMTKTKLEKLEKKVTPAMEAKHFKRFSKEAQSLGNGVYGVCGQYSTDTRELFLIYVAIQENIKF